MQAHDKSSGHQGQGETARRIAARRTKRSVIRGRKVLVVQADGVGDVAELLLRDIFQPLATVTELLVESHGRLLHHFVGFLATAEEAEILPPGNADVPVLTIVPDTQQPSLALRIAGSNHDVLPSEALTDDAHSPPLPSSIRIIAPGGGGVKHAFRTNHLVLCRVCPRMQDRFGENRMPYELLIRDDFSAAHHLREYKGKCEQLHGHNWHVELRLAGSDLDAAGMLLDFGDVKHLLGEVLGQLDHVYLNDVPPFDTINPSSENLARVIAERMAERLPEAVRVVSVTTWESDRCGATYRPSAAKSGS